MLGMPLKPQGRQVARLLETRKGKRFRYSKAVVQMPRRAAKTTSIWSTIIGRCDTIPGYQVVITAQDGTRASSIMVGFMEILRSNGFEDVHGNRLLWSAGNQKIKYANGSVMWVVPPKPGAFRSASADCILFEEAGELDPETSGILMAAALPLMDTRPNPQVIITGTPSEGRAGMLWDALENGRAAKPGWGILDYSIRDDETLGIVDEDGNTTLDEELLKRVHPGIGTLTTMKTMRERFAVMQLPMFEREYAGRFGFDNTTHAIDPAVWADAAVPVMDRPERVGIAYDCAIDGSSSTLAYAWRDAAGVAYVEVVEHRAGTTWLPSVAHRALQKYRGVPIAYDQIGANLDPGTALSRFKPSPKVDRINMKDLLGASQRFVALLHDGNLKHFGQTDLDAAVENAAWREIQHSGRAFGSKNRSGAAINPLVACSLALWSYDRGKDRQRLSIAI